MKLVAVGLLVAAAALFVVNTTLFGETSSGASASLVGLLAWLFAAIATLGGLAAAGLSLLVRGDRRGTTTFVAAVAWVLLVVNLLTLCALLSQRS